MYPDLFSRFARTVPCLARLVLAAVLLAAAVPKLLRPDAFLAALEAWRLLPAVLLAPTAIVLPWVEAVTGLALLAVRPLRRGALLLGGGLPVVFAAALLVNRVRGVEVPCGCFSLDPASQPAGWTHVLLNLAMVALAVAAAHGDTRKARRDAPE